MLRADLEKGGAGDEIGGVRLTRFDVQHGDASEVVYQGPPGPAAIDGPERIIGTPLDPSCLDGVTDREVSGPPPLLRRIESARIIGTATVLDGTGRMYSPGPFSSAEAIGERADQAWRAHDGFVLAGTGSGYELIAAEPPVPEKLGLSVAFIHNLEAGNYGAFLVRQLVQLFMLKRASITYDAIVVPSRTAWFRDALGLLGLPEVPLLEAREIAGRPLAAVYLSTAPSTPGLMRPEDRESLHALIGYAGSLPKASERLYVSRTLATIARPSHRVLTNEIDVEAAANAAGYKSVQPETLSLADQIALFASASQLIGPSGSGMLNAVFARPGTRLVNLEAYHTNLRQHSAAFGSTGKRYAFAFGNFDGDHPETPKVKRPWRIPLDIVEEALDWLDQRS